jgi:hypothetical protein
MVQNDIRTLWVLYIHINEVDKIGENNISSAYPNNCAIFGGSVYRFTCPVNVLRSVQVKKPEAGVLEVLRRRQDHGVDGIACALPWNLRSLRESNWTARSDKYDIGKANTAALSLSALIEEDKWEKHAG